MVVWARRVRVRTSAPGAMLLAFLSIQSARAVPAAPVLQATAIAGPRVTLAWSAVPGALGYRLAVGPAPGTEAYAQAVGPVTTVMFDAPFVGTGYIRVQAFDATGLGPASNEVAVTITTLIPVPAAPINLQAALSGTAVSLVWAAGSGGGPPLGVVLEAGTAPGAANLGALSLPLSTQATVPAVTPGTYFVRAYAVNGSGRSRSSNEVRVDMPIGGGCTTPGSPSLTPSVSGTTVSFAWSAVAGAASYRLEVGSGPSGPVLLSESFAAPTTSRSYPNAPAGTHYARLFAVSACGAEAPSAMSSFTVTAPPPGTGPRTPNPPPGQRLPLPNMSSVVTNIGNAYRGDLLNSCRDSGGNNVWLFRLVEELRRHDTRWGLNWKRGNVGDMSQDIVNYNFSADPDEGTTNVYIIDVIGGHCGSNPQPSWIDVTEATRTGGTIGRWTLQPYIAAGGQP
ncbi:MAG TPA: hypothetical protein PLH72_17920 [Vicinamibacterales bacterium]|nr:hypothetical protein [Vicinamibacterales bacterium]